MSAERLAIQLKNDFSTRIPELDGLRGVAVLLIIFYHYFQQQIGAEPGTPLAFLKAVGAFTWSGIDLFLVLSGFLIGGILFDTRTSDSYFKAFYIRRACRILPPCALFYIILFGANHVAGESFEGLHRPGN